MVVWSTSTPAIEQHQFEIAVADWEHQVPPDRPQNHLVGKLPSLELLAPTHCRPALRLRRANPTGPAPSAKPCNRAASALPRIVAEASRLARSDKSVQIFPEIIG